MSNDTLSSHYGLTQKCSVQMNGDSLIGALMVYLYMMIWHSAGLYLFPQVYCMTQIEVSLHPN